MKRLIIAALGIFTFSAQLLAQPKKSGAIQFQSTFDPAAMAAANGIRLSDEVIARMPKKSVTGFELLFNATNASYTPVEDIEDSNNSGGGGPRFGGFGGANREYYYNLAEHKLTEVFDLNDTTYFLQNKLGAAATTGFGQSSTPPVIEVIKSDETKKILGFDCKKVTVKTTVKRKIQDEEKEITDQTVLWYTADLGFEFSPNPSLWTEGAVLQIEGKGTQVVAESIEYRNVSNKDVSLPKKGTVITLEEFRAKMEQMRKQRGNRNGRPAVRSMTIN